MATKASMQVTNKLDIFIFRGRLDLYMQIHNFYSKDILRTRHNC